MTIENVDILARLQTLIAERNAKVMSDPLPYLSQAERELIRARKCFDEILRALSPDIVFDFCEENKIHPIDIQGEALIRCNAALKILDNYFEQ